MNTGGPAFPMMSHTNCHGLMLEEQAGMTLRDYFAAKAMQGMLAENGGGARSNDDLAVIAYALADSMLKARES